ncbi:hypothetical protein Alsa1_CDS0125 [Staphylococcus phage Alsa_1]|nr:hypothetical protein Alsa1_CDS0125 [Staphylococcus phage Alsa_1]
MKKTFTIEVEMEERWVNHFMSMLDRMEQLGSLGASRKVSIYADGDGDFRPKFKANIDWEKVNDSKVDYDLNNNHYDAG